MNPIKNSNANKRILTPEQLVNETPRGEPVVAFRNPTGVTVQVEIYISEAKILHEGIEGEDGTHVGRRVQAPTFCRATWAPGQIVELPASAAAGLHLVDRRTGAIVGGLAPQLRRVGADEPIFAAGIGGR